MTAVERYLDEMFDRLAGTGAAGRRALAEAEDHLSAAVADGTAAGLSTAEAERAAVARFGPPARIAAGIRHAHRGDRLNAALSGAWLLAGLGLVAIAGAFLITGLDIAVLLRMHPETLPSCHATTGPLDNCSTSAPIMWWALTRGLIALLAGAAALAGRLLAIRLAGLAPAPPRFPLLATALFAAAGVAIYAFAGGPRPDGFLGLPQGPGLWMPVTVSGVAVLTAVAVAVGGLVRARRPRYR